MLDFFDNRRWGGHSRKIRFIVLTVLTCLFPLANSGFAQEPSSEYNHNGKLAKIINRVADRRHGVSAPDVIIFCRHFRCPVFRRASGS